MKITNEQIEELEAESLIDALGNCLELNDAFLDRYASFEFAALLKQVPEKDRGHIIAGVEETHYYNGTPAVNNYDIWLDVSEIEEQFEGDPKDVFETPEDLVIHGNCAYLYVGYGLSVNFNRAQIEDAIKAYKEDRQ